MDELVIAPRRQGAASYLPVAGAARNDKIREEEEAMFELTDEQRRELSEPEPTAVDPQTKEAYVLVPREIYERVKDKRYDDSPWTDEEMDLLAAEAADLLGWEGMDGYQAARDFA